MSPKTFVSMTLWWYPTRNRRGELLGCISLVHSSKCAKANCASTFRILESVAQDHALEDAMYALKRGLEEGALDLSTYVKLIRKLSRQQFFCRAVSLKIYADQDRARAQKV